MARATRVPTEAQILRSILDYLAARHIFHLRINSGAMVSEYKGRKHMIRMAKPGTADILVFNNRGVDPDGAWCDYIQPCWLEVKTAKGKQSEHQIRFQQEVEGNRHKYAVVRSIEDVEAALK